MANIVFMGSSEFAVPALDAIVGAGHTVMGVYTQPDKPAGRGRQVRPTPVKLWAAERGLTVHQPASLRDTDAMEGIRALAPEVIVVAAYGKLLPQPVLDIPPSGTLNLHPSLLPKYRGPSPVAAAILAGDAMTGVTIMLLDAGMDTGPTLSQRRAPIRPDDNQERLETRLATVGAELLVETLGRWLEGEVSPVPQNEGDATTSRLITKAAGEIDWTDTAEAISRKVRAFWPWPGAYTNWSGAALRIIDAQAIDAPSGEPGSVVFGAGTEGPTIAIATGAGSLLVIKLQVAGGKQTMARDFVAGHRDFVVARLPS